MIGTQALYKGHYQRAANAAVAVAAIGGTITKIDPPKETRFLQFNTDVALVAEIGYDDDAMEAPTAVSFVIKDGDQIQINDSTGKQAHIWINGRTGATTATFWIYIK